MQEIFFGFDIGETPDYSANSQISATIVVNDYCFCNISTEFPSICLGLVKK
jgi:hypothetical protein